MIRIAPGDNSDFKNCIWSPKLKINIPKIGCSVRWRFKKNVLKTKIIIRSVPDPDEIFCPLMMVQVQNLIFIVNQNSIILCCLFRYLFRIYMYIGDTYVLISYIKKRVFVHMWYLHTDSIHIKGHFQTASILRFVNILYCPILFLMLPTCCVGFVTVTYLPVPPCRVLSFHFLYCHLPTLYVLLFHIASHTNPFFPAHTNAPWTVTYRFIPTYSVLTHSVPSHCNQFRVFPYWPYLLPSVVFHSLPSSCDPILLLFIPIWCIT